MIRAGLGYAIGAFFFCAALAPRPMIADSLQDCKDRVGALQEQHANDPDLAIEACTNFLATAEDDQALQGHLFRAIAYFYKPDYYHAVKDFDVVINQRQVQVAYIYRGLAYMGEMADDPAFADSAISDLTNAANLGSVDDEKKAQFWPAYLTRAGTNLKKGEDENALSDEDEAVRLNPEKAVAIKADFAQSYKQRAMQSLANGQYDRAASDFQHAIQLDPTGAGKLTPYLTEAQSGQLGPYSAIARGIQHAEDQDYEQALKDYSEAIRMNPHLAEAYLDRGYAHMGLDGFEDARTDFAEAIRLDENDWSGYYARGKLYESMDQFDQAAADFNQASAIIERVHDWEYDYAKGLIENARKSLQFSRTIQDRWVSYLKEIQAARTYSNWTDSPYDLYVAHHSLGTGVAVEPPVNPQPAAPKDNPPQPGRPVLVVVMVGIIVVVVLFATIVLARRRRRQTD